MTDPPALLVCAGVCAVVCVVGVLAAGVLLADLALVTCVGSFFRELTDFSRSFRVGLLLYRRCFLGRHVVGLAAALAAGWTQSHSGRIVEVVEGTVARMC